MSNKKLLEVGDKIKSVDDLGSVHHYVVDRVTNTRAYTKPNDYGVSVCWKRDISINNEVRTYPKQWIWSRTRYYVIS